jgi:hypothetical protein
VLIDVYRAVPVRFLFSLWDVEVGLGITECLCEAEIDNVNLVAALTDAHQEVVRFDVAVNKLSRVDIFNARNLIAVGMRRKEK